MTVAQVTSFQDSTHVSGRFTRNIDCEPRLEQHVETFLTFLALTSIVGFLLPCCLSGFTIGTTCERFLIKPDIFLIGTTLFGLGSVTWFLLRLVSDVFYTNGSHTNMTHSGTQLAFVGLETLFLIAHSNTTITSNFLTKVFLMHVLATNFCLWLQTVAGETVEREQHLPLVCNQTITEIKCINRSALNLSEFNLVPANRTGCPGDILNLVEKSTTLLYPSMVEFYISAIISCYSRNGCYHRMKRFSQMPLCIGILGMAAA